MTPQDRARDSYGSWCLAIAALRERNIRAGTIKPDPDRPNETRWQREGVRVDSDLDVVRHPPPTLGERG